MTWIFKHTHSKKEVGSCVGDRGLNGRRAQLERLYKCRPHQSIADKHQCKKHHTDIQYNLQETPQHIHIYSVTWSSSCISDKGVQLSHHAVLTTNQPFDSISFSQTVLHVGMIKIGQSRLTTSQEIKESSGKSRSWLTYDNVFSHTSSVDCSAIANLAQEEAVAAHRPANTARTWPIIATGLSQRTLSTFLGHQNLENQRANFSTKYSRLPGPSTSYLFLTYS